MRTLRAIALCTLLGIAASAAAQQVELTPQPNDFARAWPIEGDAGDGLLRLALTPGVYAQLARDDLSDIAAFNAADEAIPLGPVALVLERTSRAPVPTPVALPLFAVPRTVRGSDSERVTLRVAKDVDGRLRRLDAELAAPEPVDAPQDLLLDLSALDNDVVGLQLALAPDTARLSARVDVEGSSDLSNWRGLARDQAVVSLNENGVRLERLRIEFAATDLPYLRLRRVDTNTSLPLASAHALRARRTLVPEPARESFDLAGEGDKTLGGAFEYLSAGPFPIERVAIELAERNAVSRVVLESRDDPGLPWRERARGSAFRLGAEGEIGAAPFDIAAVRDRHWRVRTEPAQPRAPTLTLSYRPDQFVLLAQGVAPYRLAAGSRRTQRPDYPLRVVLAEVQSRRGDSWLPPEARLGVSLELAGEAALMPRPKPATPASFRHWLLWGVLLAGAALVVGMVLHLLRNADSGDKTSS